MIVFSSPSEFPLFLESFTTIGIPKNSLYNFPKVKIKTFDFIPSLLAVSYILQISPSMPAHSYLLIVNNYSR